MRHAAVLGLSLTVLAAAPVVTAAAGTPAPRSAADPPAALSGRPFVAYRGLRIPVPAGWEVHRLDRDPTRCVRFDRRAIYLGRPGPQADCPARVVDRTEAVLVEPVGDASARRRLWARPDLPARVPLRTTADHRIEMPLPEAGVRVTGTYGADEQALRDTLRASRIAGAWPAEPVPRHGTPDAPDEDDEEDTPEEADMNRPWATGKGFDTCAAPALASMAAWRKAYDVANIYIGGAARGCAQPNLDAAWVRTVRKMGYRLIPTYVGPQSPCSRYRVHFDPKDAAGEGTRAARDAVRQADALGIPEGKPIYYDMEAYDSRKDSCRKPVLRFLDAWSREVARLDYVPGVYSSIASGVRDLGKAGDITKPDAIWFARWDGEPTIYDDLLEEDWWHPHRRIKQYRGGHRERHGGVTINVDSNTVDGRVY
ncbi:DUF1906 domain-containing protein [Actinomadura macrotermitis]|uniref:Rv2525c-like glycoside hydrolase-like domain-containing protein n=1 Tax=Actinomadura macrotermitis TaxID=2585200 RepID=A0A7K0BNE5_9ACTN|nr:DUF1906 domain-containing protein [Actinomadura macrotermitis]MQY02708.1 hypothetical protein [Actinomadura macrotermitis]